MKELDTSLVNVMKIGLEGNHLCRLITKHGGVHLLVGLLTNNKFHSVKSTILRSIATVCCVLESIRQLEEMKGVEVISRILGDRDSSEVEKGEAAGVLAQITSTWIKGNNYVLEVTELAFYLVKSLTGE